MGWKIETLEDLRRFLEEFFKDQEVEVYLFGSRARGDFSPYSDVDIAILSRRDLSEKLTLLREILEESNFPLKVDIVELKKAPYLVETVKKEGIRWL
ncbi:MAG TPA: nucleotidyltransferase domain-containing protein [Aquificales bacterium]|nr:nucleotidyltransferase domain-containing protein [Aquificales bacterium]